MAKIIPSKPITLLPEQVMGIHKEVKALFHTLNNRLTVLVNGCALGKENPSLALQMLELIASTMGQPNQILEAAQRLSSCLDGNLQILNDPEQPDSLGLAQEPKEDPVVKHSLSVFFLQCQMLVAVAKGKFEDDLVRISQNACGLEVLRLTDQTPLLKAVGPTPEEICFKHPDWFRMAAHVARCYADHCC